MICFGDFEFNVETNELRRKGVLVRLQSQPAQVLATLLVNAEKVVSREELQAAVWGDGTFVDYERGLNFCMTQVRAALGEDAARPVYIRTIPRKGYQFIAPVTVPVKSPVVAAVAERIQPHAALIMPKPIPVFKPKLWIAGVAIFSVAVFALFAVRRGAHPDSRTASQPPSQAALQATPILAVIRFDIETTDAQLQRFADGLTDDVVIQLTSASGDHYRVVGNAPILRIPRGPRDLKAIGSSLGADYVVMGQIQSNGSKNGSKVLILAHLIRLSDLTHVWVVRTGGNLGDPLRLQSETAAQIAAQFSYRMTHKPESAASFPSGNN